ncbi:hypothetical protein [Marinobacterium zhoushanense]|uniref:hypothetical protein n=1 Tax=Marinobacterium zhoushanense TaxID=1679163 RepID=UPI00166951BA|nr:hypothetical protein [Marinobacterium zhoushanense]
MKPLLDQAVRHSILALVALATPSLISAWPGLACRLSVSVQCAAALCAALGVGGCEGLFPKAGDEASGYAAKCK